ncbi:alpha amylase C-terminal domain-containing protein, partial [Escherichia coli]|uniref:alpha amylase C-terminal domain-containing protein n=1 Tax=Escherichia coli TaxID=562 RepID=UPI0032E40C39
DHTTYGGSGVLNDGGLKATDEGQDGQPATLTVTLPPLGAAYFRPGATTATAEPEAAEHQSAKPSATGTSA